MIVNSKINVEYLQNTDIFYWNLFAYQDHLIAPTFRISDRVWTENVFELRFALK